MESCDQTDLVSEEQIEMYFSFKKSSISIFSLNSVTCLPLFSFQLNQNIKNVVVRSNKGKQCYLMITLKDSSFLTVDKIPPKDAEEMKLYLESVQNRVHTSKCKIRFVGWG